MKTLIKTRKEFYVAGRWDIDFHLPAVGIQGFPNRLLARVDSVAAIAKDKRDPTREPENSFQYIDIAAVDVTIGVVMNPQDVEGADAASRARKVVSAYDLIVSTCRPTRGAIAVVPVKLHNQIASTAFSILRPLPNVNPFYLHYALRLESTLEQFRKWSTGSSYPAILDSDVAKTLIPVPEPNIQDAIAARIVAAMRERDKVINAANRVWTATLDNITSSLSGKESQTPVPQSDQTQAFEVFTTAEIAKTIRGLPKLTTDNGFNESEEELFS
jgi:hypothetical protein